MRLFRFVVLATAVCLFTAAVCLEKAEAETVITVFAQAYTPDIVTGDNPRPLVEFSRLAREWEKLNPGVKVRFIRQPVGDYRVWMITQLKGGTAPDIMWAQAQYANEDKKYGWFIELDPYLAKPNKYTRTTKPWIDYFYEDATNARRAADGKLYVLPIDQVETGIYYNKDIFRKVGVQPPDTWEELLEVSRKLDAAGYVPMLFVGDQMRFGWARNLLHDQLWDDKLPEIDVKDEGFGFLGVDTQEFVRAYKKGIWSPQDPRYRDLLRILKDWSQTWNPDWPGSSDTRLFRRGHAGMFWEGSWYTSQIRRDPLREFEYGVFPVPRLTKKTSLYAADQQPRGLGGATAIQFGITKTAVDNDRVELAVDFLQYITTPENLGRLVGEAEMFLPNSPGVTGSPILEPFQKTLEVGPILFPGEPSAQQYDDVVYRAMQSFLAGSASLDDTVALLDESIAREVDRLIRENPQWRFTSDWEILPDGDVDTRATADMPVWEKYVPWALLGILLVVAGLVVLPGKAMGSQKRLSRNMFFFIFPTLLLLVVFSYYPIFSAFYHSFFEWKGSGEATFIGMANFRELIGDSVLRKSAWNALLLMAFGIGVGITLPLLVAELIFHLKSGAWKYFYRVMFVVPMVVPGIVMLLIWGFIYDYNLGVVNTFLRSVGMDHLARAWLGDPNIALYSMMFIGFPFVGGFGLLIYYAGLQGISKDIFESCSIDGASPIRRFFAVDFPLLLPQTKLLVVLGLINGIQGFQNQLLLTNGGPGYATMVPGLHLYLNAISYDRMGYACAIGVALFAIILLLTYLNLKYVKTETEHEAK